MQGEGSNSHTIYVVAERVLAAELPVMESRRWEQRMQRKIVLVSSSIICPEPLLTKMKNECPVKSSDTTGQI